MKCVHLLVYNVTMTAVAAAATAAQQSMKEQQQYQPHITTYVLQCEIQTSHVTHVCTAHTKKMSMSGQHKFSTEET